jgi:hypothetical protein
VKWRRLHDKEPYNFYSSPYIIQVMSRKIIQTGRVARMGEVHKGLGKENRVERNHLKNVGVDVKIILTL